MTLRACKACGKFFEVQRGVNDQKKYCNHACVQRAYRQRHKKAKPVRDKSYGFFIGPCPVCGKDMWGTNKRQKYCNNVCRTRAFRARQKASIEASTPILERAAR